MTRRVVWVLSVAMLLVVMVAVWSTESRRSTDLVWLGAVVGGGVEEHEPKLATTVEALDDGISMLRRRALVELGGQQLESIQRPRVHTVRRTARGPPGGASSARCMNEGALTKEEKTC